MGRPHVSAHQSSGFATIGVADSLPSVPSMLTGPTQRQQGEYPTIWGLNPIELHDNYWASRGVFVVRPGETTDLPKGAELFLLTDAHTFAIFRLASLIETLSWVKPSVLFLRLAAQRSQDYREIVDTDSEGGFKRFRRFYGHGVLWSKPLRLALTRDRAIAAVWLASGDSRIAWRNLRRQARFAKREIKTIRGRAYHADSPQQMADLANYLLITWERPASTIAGIHRVSNHVWAHHDSSVGQSVEFVETVWIGAGRRLEPGTTVLGPAILWDDPAQRPSARQIPWSDLEPSKPAIASRTRRLALVNRRGPRGKRLFDIVVAMLVLLGTLPLYPIVMLAIWIEDGRPLFFAHRRQTLGGREFRCLKFRSMRRNAEALKRKLSTEDGADGPQFYFKDDPRVTRVGKLLRRTYIDELPQFINVLIGDMSVVGPRPSPSSENQFNPAWREARLSVRAGITGLWQVRRTRRPGLDFQEWIKYDMEYVNGRSWWMDLNIILRTIRMLLKGGSS